MTKLRWLAHHEPDAARRTHAVCLPHDWLTWRLRATGDLADLVTDRGDASGTGYIGDSLKPNIEANRFIGKLRTATL